MEIGRTVDDDTSRNEKLFIPRALPAPGPYLTRGSRATAVYAARHTNGHLRAYLQEARAIFFQLPKEI